MRWCRRVFAVSQPETIKVWIPPTLTFPGRKFQFHSSSIIALRRHPFLLLRSFRIKTFLFFQWQFSPEQENKNIRVFSVPKKERTFHERQTRDINSDRIRKNENWFCPKRNKYKIWKVFHTVWKANFRWWISFSSLSSYREK